MSTLVKRHELKFVISYIDYIVISQKLDILLMKDPNSITAPYSITSLYFDDIYNSALSQKIEGDAYRYKYRIRYYDNNLNYFKLEKKEKINQITHKESLTLSEDEVKKILNQDISFLLDKKDELANEFHQIYKKGLLKPKVLVNYKRDAYIHRLGDLRVTFDLGFKSSINNTNPFDKHISYTSAIAHHEVIMEVKFTNHFPNYLKSIFQLAGSTQTSMSKYVYSRQYTSNH